MRKKKSSRKINLLRSKKQFFDLLKNLESGKEKSTYQLRVAWGIFAGYFWGRLVGLVFFPLSLTMKKDLQDLKVL